MTISSHFKRNHLGWGGGTAVAALPIFACLQNEQANFAARRCTNSPTFAVTKEFGDSIPASTKKIIPDQKT